MTELQAARRAVTLKHRYLMISCCVMLPCEKIPRSFFCFLFTCSMFSESCPLAWCSWQTCHRLCFFSFLFLVKSHDGSLWSIIFPQKLLSLSCLPLWVPPFPALSSAALFANRPPLSWQRNFWGYWLDVWSLMDVETRCQSAVYNSRFHINTLRDCVSPKVLSSDVC